MIQIGPLNSSLIITCILLSPSTKHKTSIFLNAFAKIINYLGFVFHLKNAVGILSFHEKQILQRPHCLYSLSFTTMKSKSALSFANRLCSVLCVNIPLHYCREYLSSNLRFLNRKNSSPSLECTVTEFEGTLKLLV